MNRILIAMLAAAFMSLGLTGWRWSVTSKALNEAQKIINTLSAGIESRDRAISRLDSENRQSQQREVALRQRQGQASVQALTREIHIQRENDANPMLRTWSAAALPADVIRLHSRPAFANARDYLDWLSARDKLPNTEQQPAFAGRSGGG